MRLACNINFFRFVSNSFLKDLNFCKHPFLNTWLSIVWHLKIPCFSSNVLASILSAFAIGIIDNPLGIARTVAKNAWGICVFPLESFRFKNAYALHPPETVRCFIDARLDEISFFFIEKPPCQQFVTPCIGCPYIGSRKNKGKIFQASVCASFFPLHGSVHPHRAGSFFFFEGNVELFFKCSVAFFFSLFII